MDPAESTDFDFFDSPRKSTNDYDSDGERDKNNSRSHTSKPTEANSNPDDVKNKKNLSENRRSLSSLSESSAGDDNYSSDSVSSLSDNDESDSKRTQNKQSHSKRSYSSGSSTCSSYRSQHKDDKISQRNRARKRSDSRSGSDENSYDISKSKSSTSGNASYSERKGKCGKESRENKKSVTKTNKDSSKNRRSRQEEEENYSSSAYSDGEETSNGIIQSPVSAQNNRSKGGGAKRQEAWGVDADGYKTNKQSSSKTTSKERPKTAKQKSRDQHSRRKQLSPRSDSDALSDSDITDVSPMDSPRTHGRSNVGAAGDGDAHGKARFKAIPLDNHDLDEDFDESQADSSAGIDLNILMKAVGELEKKKRVEANSRRVMFAPMTLKRNEKSNYTFDKGRTSDIDRENDRLLKEIVKQVQADRKKQYFKSPAPPKSKVTPSAINREKEMRRIETDNINFLKRLQKVKATSTISRNNQLKEYDNTKLHGIPMATLHPVSRTSSRASGFMDSYSSIGSRTRSMTSLHSVASTVRSTSSKRSSRPSSATKRVDMRPEWNDRWSQI